MSVTVFRVKETMIIIYVEALVVEDVVAMESVLVLMDGVVQPVTALLIRVAALTHKML